MSRPSRNREKTDNARSAIANEAARIIQEQGLNDYRAAKDKARERLGLRSAGPLPSNEEIEEALAARNRIFGGDGHLRHLDELRRAALDVMRALQRYNPRLVGSVLSGNATAHSSIDLHLFSDPSELVAESLDVLGVKHRCGQNSCSFRRGESEQFPVYKFAIDEREYRATVFPELRRRSSPFSPVDGKPMERAAVKELEQLIEAGSFSAY